MINKTAKYHAECWATERSPAEIQEEINEINKMWETPHFNFPGSGNWQYSRMETLKEVLKNKRYISDICIGDQLDLENDPIADNGEHPEFEFDYEIVLDIEPEPGCIRIDFESGFSCGFPVTHVFKINPEQVR
jgi:hypothetical protein